MALQVAGYADDTAIYLNNSTEINATLKIVHEFGEVYGPRLKGKKTTDIALHEDGFTSAVKWVWPVTLQFTEVHSRYLGIQVGCTNGPTQSWELAVTQLCVRLRLKSQKTLTVDQRTRVSTAFIDPKRLYIVRLANDSNSYPHAEVHKKLRLAW